MTYSPIARSRPRWGWIAAAGTLLILVTVFWLTPQFHQRDADATVAAARDEGSASLDGASAIREYVQFARTVEAQPDLAAMRIADGLRKLAGALAMLNAVDPALAIDLRVDAEHIVLNPSSRETTSMIRDHLFAAADALELDTDTDGELRRSVESIRLDRPLLEQLETVFQFFQHAADAFERRPSAIAAD